MANYPSDTRRAVINDLVNYILAAILGAANMAYALAGYGVIHYISFGACVIWAGMVVVARRQRRRHETYTLFEQDLEQHLRNRRMP